MCSLSLATPREAGSGLKQVSYYISLFCCSGIWAGLDWVFSSAGVNRIYSPGGWAGLEGSRRLPSVPDTLVKMAWRLDSFETLKWSTSLWSSQCKRQGRQTSVTSHGSPWVCPKSCRKKLQSFPKLHFYCILWVRHVSKTGTDSWGSELDCNSQWKK